MIYPASSNCKREISDGYGKQVCKNMCFLCKTKRKHQESTIKKQKQHMSHIQNLVDSEGISLSKMGHNIDFNPNDPLNTTLVILEWSTQNQKNLPSLKLTFSYLKIDGWKITFLLGPGLFSGAFAVSFREGTVKNNSSKPEHSKLSGGIFPANLQQNPIQPSTS